MKTLAAQRCFNHVEREAAARCTECRHFFCRECISEHDGRVICAGCLRQFGRKTSAKGRGFAVPSRIVQFCLGVLAAWFFFYLVGEVLLAIPSSFHEGTVWRTPWLESDSE